MKPFFHRHKIVLLALAGVLCIGILAGLVIGGTIRLSMTERAFSTVADAKAEERAARAESLIPAIRSDAKETPDAPGVQLSAKDVSRIVQEVESRRRYIIPVRTNSYPAQNVMLWTEEQPDREQIAFALAEAEKLTEILFHASLGEMSDAGGTPTVRLYTDKAGDRGAILCVSDPEGNYLLTLRESDGRLLCADLMTYPETEMTENAADAALLAQKLGYRAKLLSHDTYGRPAYESVYEFTTDGDECLAFSYCGDRLWQAAIYPNEQAMHECEYFLADLQMDYYMHAYPERFAKADPPALSAYEMVTDTAIKNKLARLYTKLTGGETLDTSKLSITFFRDESGVREDCWKVEGLGFEIVISAYSRTVISLECDVPCRELLGIPYEEMGGGQYEQAAAEIGQYLFTSLGAYDDGSHSGETHGKAVKAVSVNAVHDGDACTMDVELEDGTFYELGFSDGVWKYAEYYANERLFWIFGQHGWVADSVYVNRYTGKYYIPEYRDWDGALYVRPRPEN